MKMIKKVTLSVGLVFAGSAIYAQNIEDAKKAIDAEQYQKAASMLKSLVKAKSGDGENYFYLGQVYLAQDYPDSARAVFQQGVAADAKFALNYVGLGQSDLRANNAASAKTNFDKAIDLGKKDYNTYLEIGRAYVAQDKPDYKAALPVLQKADELDSKDKDPRTFVSLGDFYAKQRNNNEALGPYMRAEGMDEKQFRAKVQIGKMYKEARAWQEAEAKLKEVVAADANYGPAYRELAELYLQWGNFGADAEKTKQALDNYRKYLDLTDKSFDSRLRYAQFLTYARDYATLGQEATALAGMIKADNPKLLVLNRLKGYSAYENKQYPEALKSMTDFFAQAKDTSRIVGQDYVYLGKSKLKSGDTTGIADIMRGVAKDTTVAESLEELADTFRVQKKYDKAAQMYATTVKYNPRGKNAVTNYFWVGAMRYLQSYTAQAAKQPLNRELLVEGDSALARVNRVAPDFELAYIYRARIANMLDDKAAPKGLSAPIFEKFVNLVTVEKADKAAKNKAYLAEAYENLADWYALSDKAKAIDYLKKALEMNPNSNYATAKLQELQGPPAGAAKPKKK